MVDFNRVGSNGHLGPIDGGNINGDMPPQSIKPRINNPFAQVMTPTLTSAAVMARIGMGHQTSTVHPNFAANLARAVFADPSTQNPFAYLAARTNHPDLVAVYKSFEN